MDFHGHWRFPKHEADLRSGTFLGGQFLTSAITCIVWRYLLLWNEHFSMSWQHKNENLKVWIDQSFSCSSGGVSLCALPVRKICCRTSKVRCSQLLIQLRTAVWVHYISELIVGLFFFNCKVGKDFVHAMWTDNSGVFLMLLIVEPGFLVVQKATFEPWLFIKNQGSNAVFWTIKNPRSTMSSIGNTPPSGDRIGSHRHLDFNGFQAFVLLLFCFKWGWYRV